jgi:hypothetical protein
MRLPTSEMLQCAIPTGEQFLHGKGDLHRLPESPHVTGEDCVRQFLKAVSAFVDHHGILPEDASLFAGHLRGPMSSTEPRAGCVATATVLPAKWGPMPTEHPQSRQTQGRCISSAETGTERLRDRIPHRASFVRQLPRVVRFGLITPTTYRPPAAENRPNEAPRGMLRLP